MKLISILLIIIAFFIGLSFLINICSKNGYALSYCSQKRKIEIYPAKDKPQKLTNYSDKGYALIFYIIILT